TRKATQPNQTPRHARTVAFVAMGKKIGRRGAPALQMPLAGPLCTLGHSRMHASGTDRCRCPPAFFPQQVPMSVPVLRPSASRFLSAALFAAALGATLAPAPARAAGGQPDTLEVFVLYVE